METKREKFTEILINNNLKKEILNNFITLITINLLNTYLEKLKQVTKKKNTDELVLKYLDSLIILYKLENKFEAKKYITKLNNKQTERYKKAFENANLFKDLFIKTNFLLCLIKEKEMQNLIFKDLLNEYSYWEDVFINNKYQEFDLDNFVLEKEIESNIKDKFNVINIQSSSNDIRI